MKNEIKFIYLFICVIIILGISAFQFLRMNDMLGYYVCSFFTFPFFYLIYVNALYLKRIKNKRGD